MQGSRGAARAAAVIAVILAMWPASAARADLFEILVTDTGGGGVPDLVVGGSDLPELMSNLVDAEGEFASFAGTSFAASITFAGVPDAIEITVDPATETATLTFSVLGPGAQTFTFTGPDLWEQVEQFLQGNGADELTAFIQAINALSLVAVTDGAPLSTTARSAQAVFDRFGLHVDLTARERRTVAGEPVEAGLRGRLDGYYENVGTDVGDGNGFTLAPSLEFVFDERVSLAMLFPISYHEIDGADVLNAAAHLAVPINLIPPANGGLLALRVTPFGTLAGAASVDMVAGGLFGGGGVLGTATLLLGDLTISGSVQYSYLESLTLTVEDYDFDPGVSQHITKEGVKVTQALGDDFFIYGSVVATQFLEEAAVDEFLTPGAGFGLRKPNGFGVEFGWEADLGNDYESHRARFALQLPF